MGGAAGGGPAPGEVPGGAAPEALLAENLAWWNEVVPVHRSSAFYGVERWLAEGKGPRARELAALGPLEGLEAVQLQCHFGMDALSLLRGGAATVVGVDFSPAAIAAARELATRAGLASRAEFVCADARQAAAVLAPRCFDLVYVTLGSLAWLPSVAAWAAEVGRLLRPGGRAYVHDVHPMAGALGGTEPSVQSPYFEEVEPELDSSDVTYTDADRPLRRRTTAQWNHGLGELIGALLAQELQLVRLEEHDWTLFRHFPFLRASEIEGERRFVLPPGRPRFPLSFTLVARRLP